MAFPTTSVLDDFNRPDEGPPPSASWTNNWIGTAVGLKVVSNQAAADSAGSARSSYWNVGTFGPDSECFCTLSTAGACFVGARITTPGVGTTDGYFLYAEAGGTYIYRMDNTVQTQLGAVDPSANASGNKFGLEIVGTTLTAYRDNSGSFTSLFTRSDTNYTAAGYIGIGADQGATTRLDDFGGGTISAPANYTVINGTQAQLVNVNAGGTDVDAMSYKTTVLLSAAEAAALASSAGVLVTADATPQQIRLIVKNIVRFQSS